MVVPFFTNKIVRKKVGKVLHSYGLTEAHIDAEAFRQSIGDLAEMNRRLIELASRRDKILRLFEEHRAGLATPCSSVPAEGAGRIDHGNRTADCCQPQKCVQEHWTKNEGGKRRAAGNAYRHGLSVQTDDWDNSDDADLLVRQIVGDATSQELHHHARIAALAHLDLVRVRQIKADIVKRVFESNDSEPSLFRLRALLAEREHLKLYMFDTSTDFWIDSSATPPTCFEESRAAAFRLMIQELRKLNRYEARAHALKMRALRKVSLEVLDKKIKRWGERRHASCKTNPIVLQNQSRGR